MLKESVKEGIKEGVKEIFYLFFPDLCPVCGGHIQQHGALMCSKCMWDMPLTDYWKQVDNPVIQQFWGHLPVINACSLITYTHDGKFNSLIHDFKYNGNWRIAKRMGEWLGLNMKEAGLYNDIDVVVPVPLHFRKHLIRRYNQAEYIAEGIASALEIPMDAHNLQRIVHNRSQTKHHRRERWDNVENIFHVKHPEQLTGRHILLVDDVLTTGATIISMGESILRSVPDCRLSVATIASTCRPPGHGPAPDPTTFKIEEAKGI